MTRLRELVLLARSLRDERARIEYVLARARRSARDPRQVVSVTVPGLAHPIWLRAGGSDYFTFHQVFTDLQYQHGLGIDPLFIIDGGANIGLAAVFFATEYPRAQIFSIEPADDNFEILLRNTAPYPNIRCFKGALWPTESLMRIANPDETNPAAYTMQVADSSIPNPLQAFTPLSLLRIANREFIDVFKIDIEGAELELFSLDSREWLSRTKLLLVELHDAQRRGCGEAFFKGICHERFAFFQRKETVIVQFQR
jgi:FkbM family methyltransferase